MKKTAMIFMIIIAVMCPLAAVAQDKQDQFQEVTPIYTLNTDLIKVEVQPQDTVKIEILDFSAWRNDPPFGEPFTDPHFSYTPQPYTGPYRFDYFPLIRIRF